MQERDECPPIARAAGETNGEVVRQDECANITTTAARPEGEGAESVSYLETDEGVNDDARGGLGDIRAGIDEALRDDIIDFMDDVRAELCASELPPRIRAGFYETFVAGEELAYPTRAEVLGGFDLTRERNRAYIKRVDLWWVADGPVAIEQFLDDVREELETISLPPRLSAGFFSPANYACVHGKWRPSRPCSRRRNRAPDSAPPETWSDRTPCPASGSARRRCGA